ncbi:hypothetical protein N9948_01030 [bacterium]|nr:hypothetical protein [bacterium]
MKAIIISDDYDDKLVLGDLTRELESKGIEYTKVKADNLKSHLTYLRDYKINEPHFFFPSVYNRYPIDHIKSLYSNNSFDYIKCGNRLVAFKPSSVEVSRDGIYSPQDKENKKYFINLKPVNKVILYKKPFIPKEDVPRVFTYCHNRDAYLKAMLNSLTFSLSSCPEIPITILLNNPTKEVKAVALDFLERFPQIDVLISNKNIYWSILNVGIQWHSPKNMIVLEDDYIIPEAQKELYPFWPYQFVQRLKTSQYISCRVSFDNLPYFTGGDWEAHPNQMRMGWRYYTQKNRPSIMAQCYCTTTQMYREIAKENSVSDSFYIEKSEQIAVPNIVGYHVGWNQIQDGYYNYKNWLDGFKLKEFKVSIKSVRSGEVREIDSKNI